MTHDLRRPVEPNMTEMAMKGLIIESARRDEGVALTTMVRNSSAYEGTYRVMVANQTVDEAYIGANLVRVAHGCEGEPLGFYSMLVPGRGATGEAELDFMFVDNDAQGRGIGRALLDDLRACADAQGLSRVHIVAHPPAEVFYRRCGAHRIGLVPPSGRTTWTRPHLVVDIEQRNT